ncbi:MAG: SPOR domain-containing protein [Treponemataceae bacterium]
MKKTIFYIVLLLAAGSIFSITVNPSLDGRAIVADSSTFPPGGYYGKAPGYLPGDTVVVTNHFNGLTVEVLILGNQDASEGIAIMLSPEAAAKLQIQKGKDIYVKVQKKQAIPFENAVSTNSKKASVNNISDPDKNSTVLPGKTEESILQSISKETSTTEESELEQMPVDEAPVESTVITETEIEDSAEITEEVTQVLPEESKEVPVSTEEFVENEIAEKVEENLSLPLQEIQSVQKEDPSDEVFEIAEIDDKEINDEKIDYVEEIPEESKAQIVKEEKNDDFELAEVENDDGTDEFITIEVELVETEPVYPSSEEESVESVVENNDEKAPVEIVLETQEKIDEDFFSSMVISPEESVEQDSEDKNELSQQDAKDIFSQITGETVEIEENILDDMENESENLESVVSKSEELFKDNLKFNEKYSKIIYNDFSLTPKTKQNNSKTYYLQIASLENEDNIEKIIDTYASKYPVKLVKASNTKNYQVMIGPLNDDEYEIVRARFKAIYKDAYLRLKN